MTQEFEASYFARFPLRVLQKQGGVYYGETQEHYETWLASRESLKQKLLSDEMVTEAEEVLMRYMHSGTNKQAKAALEAIVREI